MTAPTPSTDEEIVASLRNLTPGFGTEEEAADRIEALSADLAAVTAERDQAREALAADNKLGAFETGRIIGAAEVRKELDQARQMLADAEQKISSMELDASLREEDERFADPL